MDPVIAFLHGNRTFSLVTLVTSYAEIVSLQSTVGSVLYEDIVLKVKEAAADEMEEIDVSAHAALLFESCVVPKINTKGEMTLQLKTELVDGDTSILVNCLQQVIHIKEGNEGLPAVLKFEADAKAYLRNQTTNVEVLSDTTEVAPEPFKANWRMKREPSGSNFSGESSSRSSSLSTLAKWPTQQEMNEALSDEFSMVLPTSRPGPQGIESQEPSSSMDVEKNEPMVRLLAFARRGGMDILFPQTLHDKVLACIYVVIQVAKSPAHKEIIDMVLSVRNSKCTSQLETVSKTKIRGMLGLFKHGELMTTRSADGEYVRQMISPSIRNFSDLRDKHDAFLQRFMAEHHIFVPTAMKAEILWQFEPEARAKRLQAIDNFIAQLFTFFEGYKSQNRFSSNLGINTKTAEATKENVTSSTDDESEIQSQSVPVPISLRASPVAGNNRHGLSATSLAHHASAPQGTFSAEKSAPFLSTGIDRRVSKQEYQQPLGGRLQGFYQGHQQKAQTPSYLNFEQSASSSTDSCSFHNGQRTVHRQPELVRDIFFDTSSSAQYPRPQQTSFRSSQSAPYQASSMKPIAAPVHEPYYHQRVDRGQVPSQRHLSSTAPRSYNVAGPSDLDKLYEDNLFNPLTAQESYLYNQQRRHQQQQPGQSYSEHRPQVQAPSRSQYAQQQSRSFLAASELERESYRPPRGQGVGSTPARTAPYVPDTYPIYHQRDNGDFLASHHADPWGAVDYKARKSGSLIDHVDLEREFENSLLFNSRSSGNSASRAFSRDGDRFDVLPSGGLASRLSSEAAPSLLLFRDHSPPLGPIGSNSLFNEAPAISFS